MVTRFKGRMAIVLVGAAASFGIATPASAQVVVYGAYPENLRVERVAYWDLNLATRAGAETLYMRVGNAVENVCLYDEGRWYGMSAPGYNQCASRAWSRARPQMNGAIYRARQFGYRGY